MPVYNGERYLQEALDSLLRQTCPHFELLIIDDGSTDQSAAIIQSCQDERIRLVRNERNLGLIATLNKGLALARGEFIARMDCDDVSLPHRLARQLAYMERHPDVVLAGSWFEKRQGQRSSLVRLPVDHEAIRFFLLFDNTFLHSSILLRRTWLEASGFRFDPDFPYAEDYELWARISRHGRVANIPEVLVRYRDHEENTSHRFRHQQNATADRIRQMHLASLGLTPDDRTLQMHLAITRFQWRGSLDEAMEARDWLDRLSRVSQTSLNLPERLLNQTLDRYWYGVCGILAGQGMKTWFLYRSSPLGRRAALHWQLKLGLRCLFRQPIPVEQA